MNWESLSLVQNFVIRWLVWLFLRHNLVICALLAVALLAGCTDVEPTGFTTMRAWNNVVQGKLSQLYLALSFLTSPRSLKLAGKIIPKVDVSTAVLQRLAPLDLFSHDDNRRNLHFQVLRPDNPRVIFLKDSHLV